MSGTFPTTGFTALDLQSNSTSKLSESVSGKTQRIRSGGQYWSFSLKSPPLERAEFNSIFSFIVQQDGRVEAFTVIPPVISDATGTASGTITVADVDSVDPLMTVFAGTPSVGIDGVATGTLKTGDLIKFSNHSKVYMLSADVNLDGSTVNQLSFHPPLVESVVGAVTTVIYDRVFLEKDEIGYTLQSDGYYRYEVAVREEI